MKVYLNSTSLLVKIPGHRDRIMSWFGITGIYVFFESDSPYQSLRLREMPDYFNKLVVDLVTEYSNKILKMTSSSAIKFNDELKCEFVSDFEEAENFSDDGLGEKYKKSCRLIKNIFDGILLQSKF